MGTISKAMGFFIGAVVLGATAASWSGEPGGEDKKVTISLQADDAEFTRAMGGRTDWEIIECLGPARGDWLPAITACKGLRELTLHVDSPAFGDDALLSVLNACPALTKLFWVDVAAFSGPVPNPVPRLTPRGLAGLKDRPALVELNLPVSAEVDAAAVAALVAAHPDLRVLVLSSADGVDDAALTALAGLPSLRGLGLLGAARVTDAGLAALANGAPALRQAMLVGSATTAAGQKAFRMRRGDVQLVTDYPPRPTPPERHPVPARFSLTIPDDADDARFRALMADRTDWRSIRLRADATDAWMADIARCPDLEVVTLQGRENRVTARGLERLAACPRLRQLTAHGTGDIDDDALIALARGCPDLSMVWTSGRRPPPGLITTKALVELAERCPQLRQVRLETVSAVGDEALAAFGGNTPLLGTLNLSGAAAATDAGLAALAGCPELYSLHVELVPEAGDAGLLALAEKCPKITDLWLSGGRGFTDAGLAAAAKAWPRLSRLELKHAEGITDDGLRALEGLPELRHLGLWSAKRLTDAGLDRLADLPIQDIILRDVKFSGEALARYHAKKPHSELSTEGAFSPVRNARQDPSVLSLGHGKVDKATFLRSLENAEAITTFHADSESLADDWLAELPRCVNLEKATIYGSRNPALTVDGLRALARCPQLKTLHINMGRRFDDAFLDALADGCPDLEVLDLFNHGDYQSDVTSAGVAALGRLPRLRELRLQTSAEVGDEALAALAKGCPRLAQLRLLGPGRVGTAGVVALAGNGTLTELHLSVTDDMGDAAVEALAAKGNPLTQLNFGPAGDTLSAWWQEQLRRQGGAGVTDAGLTALATMKSLRTLRLSGSGVTDRGLAALAKSPALVDLVLSEAIAVGDDGLAALAAGRPGLTTLDVSAARGVTDAGLLALAKEGRALSDVRVGGTAIGDAGVEALGALPALRWLELPAAENITDLGLAGLAKTGGLENLDLSSAEKLTDAGLVPLIQAHAGLARLLIDAATGVGDATLDELAKRERLWFLHIQAAEQVTTEGLDRFKAARSHALRGMPAKFGAHGAPLARIEPVKRLYLHNIQDVAEAVKQFKGRTDWNEIYYYGALDKAMLERIGQCRDLRQLTLCNEQRWGRLSAPALDVADFEPIFHMPKLTHLHITDYIRHLDDKGLIRLFTGFPHLVSLGLQANITSLAATDEGFDHIALLPDLTDLHYGGSFRASLLTVLARGAPNLKLLRLGDKRIGDLGVADVAALSEMKALTDLDLPIGPDTGDETLSALVEACPNLTRLRLPALGAVTPRGLAPLADVKRLEHLTLTGVTDEDVEALSRLPALTHLTLDNGHITDRGLAVIARMATLRELQLSAWHEGDIDITDQGVALLAKGLPSLTALRLYSSFALGDPSLVALRGHPNLRHLYLQGSAFTPEGEEKFEQQFKGDVQIHNVEPHSFRISQNATGIANQLKVPRAEAVTVKATHQDGFTKALDNRPGWRVLRLESSRMTDDWMRVVTGNKALAAFSNTSYNPEGLTSAGVGLLGQCPDLRLLSICTANTVEEKDWLTVLQGCPKLEALQICDSGPVRTGAAFFEALSRAKDMKFLQFRGLPDDAHAAFFACLDRLPALAAVFFQEPVNLPEERVQQFRKARPKVAFYFQRPAAGEAPPADLPPPLAEPPEIF